MKAAFCGSFDPPTLGHIDLIQRASKIFSQVVVFISPNSEKSGRYSNAKRKAWLEDACKDMKNVSIQVQQGLAVEAARNAGCKILIRGIRNETDMAYEANMAAMNHCIDGSIETFCMFCRPEYTYISSSNVRELIKYGVSIQEFVPAAVYEDLQGKLALERNNHENNH